MNDVPFIAAHQKVAEITVRGIFLAMVLTILLAISNAYLALKLGILTSASIPAAIISMGILRFFKHSTILENNAVQTAASAGEAVAGGIVYTIPALIVIGFWDGFDYFTNFFIAACGGVLGVLFSIPLRRILVNEKALRFPEGRAIAEVLKSTIDKTGMNTIFMGGLVGGVVELFQVGFKMIASSWSHWFIVKRSLLGLSVGFSATMIGAGYLIGHDMAVSIFIGAILSWVIAMPLVSRFYPELLHQHSPEQAVTLLWNSEMRYLGIGAMLFAGVWTFVQLIKPLVKSISASFDALTNTRNQRHQLPRTDKDIPLPYILMLIALVAAVLFLFFQKTLPLKEVGLDHVFGPSIVFFAVIYVLFIGFIFSVITAYFSGMVGVTASPGSSVVISGMLFAAWLLLAAIDHLLPLPLTAYQIQAAEAITIIVGSVVTGIAAIANDNTQDLKVGQLVGATPWKQQVMLLLGVMVSSLVIPPVMQLLFNVYGIAGVMPHPGMDVSQSLPAPTAALMAAITEAVFRDTLPGSMICLGAGLILLVIGINYLFKRSRLLNLSILGVAVGMYLPLSSSFPLFMGGLMALFIKRRLKGIGLSQEEERVRQQNGTLIACGLVAGAAIIDVVLAIPFSIFHSPDALRLVNVEWEKTTGVLLGVLTLALLGGWIRHRVCDKK